MRIELLYGKATVPLDLPDTWDVTVIEKAAMPVLADPVGAVERVLGQPTGAAPLIESARGARTACILICDVTRPVPNGLLLPPLVRTLLDAGVPADGITILVATGLHRPNLDDELAEVVGDPWVLETVRVENHFALDDDAHVDLGPTAHGTPVRIDRRFVEADVRIATGLVEPHFMAGWSGGRKVIAPGVAHRDTITTFHNHAFMAHPRAANCVLDGNPLHREQLAIVEKVGGALALNVVIDDHRRPCTVTYGEIVESHLKAVDFVRAYAAVSVPRRFHTVVTSAAGYPLDKTYYQTVKGMVGPLDILEEGGDLIIASDCSEGMGSGAYVEAQRRLLDRGVDGFLEDIARKDFADIDEWQTQMQIRTMRRGTIRLYAPRLGDALELTGVESVPDLTAAVHASVARHGDTSVAVVPEGPYVIPVLGGAA
ncbi:nickel-dependent lactate racemase [Roseospira marina]|uniref:Nickel-dependent lactate racemase n=1 Tax=Roseospira marina TaxID=140057 RepID=A0A5M6ID45_9PROT|nr:nickel-dependent lactate racemase [Roseospira marina]KAA5605992.1 nickel-dependent lactate racemase [Roseospira marina]MBB4313156.1 nickel-dependent lactate racemase [Roseospira marina]MBB5086103.1 nickel-dependent lactate racemase [Roseospira marina]